jgi:hypothetical protein
MFLVKTPVKSELWNNKLNDDFIRFLPDFFECSPSELIIHFVKKDVKSALESFEKQEGCRVEYVDGKAKKFHTVTVITQEEFTNPESGEVTTVDKEEKHEELLEEITLTPLVSSWPYEEVEGKLIFKGIQLGA